MKNKANFTKISLILKKKSVSKLLNWRRLVVAKDKGWSWVGMGVKGHCGEGTVP